MKIIADENMPLVHELFANLGEVVTLPGRSIAAKDMVDADVLLVRSITRVDRHLLEGSRVRFVGTATVGVDHVDHAYLVAHGIEFANAPGCNADAVVDYVFAALYALGADPSDGCVGIVGCGQVGGRLYRRLRELGVACRCHDPFLTASQQPDLCTLEEVLRADIVSLHTPLTTSGPYPTHHLLNADNLAQLREGAVLLNTGRGAVISNDDLRNLLARRKDLRVVLDVWQSEPDVDLALLDRVALATPHIAGYSVQGKENGTRMVHEALRKWMGRDTGRQGPDASLLPLRVRSVKDAVVSAYDIRKDDQRMRTVLAAAGDHRGEAFDQLRKNYPHRHEFSRYRVYGELSSTEKKQLLALGFR